MQTRRDQLQAYRFVTRRVMAALLHGEPDSPESPMRKLVVGTFGGVMIGVLVLAVFGVIALVKPGGAKGIEDPGTLLVEDETGASYIYSDVTDTLYPVANYTSARLALNTADITVRHVSHRSLAGYTRGPQIGIQGAPESLPDADKLVGSPWQVCDRAHENDAGTHIPVVTLFGGQDRGGQRLGPNQAILVRTSPSNQHYLIWHNTRLRTTTDAIKVFAGVSVTDLPVVGETFVNAIRIGGPGFVPPRIPDRGQPASFDPSVRIGQVFSAQLGNGTQKYVALSDGYAKITETQAELLLIGDPDTAAAYPGQEIEALDLNSTNASRNESETDLSAPGLPETIPDPIDINDLTQPLCASYDDSGDGELTVTYGADVPDTPLPNAGTVDPGVIIGTFADRVDLPNGGGALVGELPNPGQEDQVTTYFIVHQGHKYKLTSNDLVGVLGYDVSQATPLPNSLLSLIPDGPDLDSENARRPIVVAAGSSGEDPAIPPIDVGDQNGG